MDKLKEVSEILKSGMFYICKYYIVLFLTFTASDVPLFGYASFFTITALVEPAWTFCMLRECLQGRLILKKNMFKNMFNEKNLEN